MRKLLILSAIVLFSMNLPADAGWKPGEILVKLTPSALSETESGILLITESVEDSLLKIGADSWNPVFPTSRSARNQDLDRWFVVYCREGMSEEQLLSMVLDLPEIESAHLNVVLYPDDIPNDPDYDKQYAWELLEAPAGWDLIKGSPDVAVAVIDSGTDLVHQDLASAIWINTGEIPGNGIDDDGNGYIDDHQGWDFRDNDNNPSNVQPDNDHGTHVAGIIGAVTNNGIGVAGGTWGCPVMILKVFGDAAGSGAYVDDVAEAIIYAADNGALVANLSLGNTQYTQIQADAALYAYNAGVTVVASAGNGGADGIGDAVPHYPSAHEGVIGVGSTNRFDSKDGSSNYGEDWVDVYASGVAIRSTLPGNQYGNLSGTSMASPVAAALAALIKSQNPALTPDEIQARMQMGCENIDESNPSYRGELDPGRINFHFSLTETPILRAETWRVTDATGNQNREADAGETVDLDLHLKNHSWMDAANVEVTITAGPGITVNAGNSSYGTIQNKMTGVNATPFSLTVTETAHTTIPITVQISGAGGYSAAESFDLSVNNPIPSMPGFPVSSFGGFNASPRAADLDNDGFIDIISASNDGTIYAFNHDGTCLPGWPRNIGSKNHMHTNYILSAPAIADINQDGTLEVIVTDRMREVDYVNPNNPSQGTKERMVGRIHVFNHDGTDFGSSWPFVTNTPFMPSGTTPIDAGFRAAPTIADVAGDNRLEIIVGNYENKVFVFDCMGNLLPGWPVIVNTDIFGSAATWDFNADGKCEIVIATKADTEPLNTGSIYLFNGSGQLLPGFPVAAPNQVYAIPALADMDADGIPEIVYGFGDYENASGPKGVMVMDMMGRPLPGWPVTVPDSLYGAPGLGDLDQDGYPEIVACTQGSEVYSFKTDGSILPGFPVKVSMNPDSIINSSPAVADINNDGHPEILFCSEISYQQDAFLNIVHWDGSISPNTPIQLHLSGFSSPCIADIDDDGDPEVIIADTSTSVFNIPTQFDPSMQYWPTYHGNNASTGAYPYQTPLETGVNMMISNSMFTGGSLFSLSAVLTNAETTPYQDVDLFVILDVYSMYWFFPSWSQTADWQDHSQLSPGTTSMDVLTFNWPTNVDGSADNLIFWGGMLDQNGQLLGRIDYVTFGYN